MLGRRSLTPLDLERIFGLVGGDIMHGALTLDQLFSARPVLGHGRLSRALRGPLYVRLRHASRRRRHRRAGPQRGAGNLEGFQTSAGVKLTSRPFSVRYCVVTAARPFRLNACMKKMRGSGSNTS